MSPGSTLDPEMSHSKKRQRRKSIWTREKIAKLIELYRSSDCLWNHYSELYKNKDCRTKAIDNICATLGITKFDFGKKVHNLRNQFNSEMKKVERRLEESGAGNLDERTTSTKTCRWEHFETLMFLRSVIEPRPGYQTLAQTQFQKTRSNVDYTDEPTVASVGRFDDMHKLLETKDNAGQDCASQLSSDNTPKADALFSAGTDSSITPATCSIVLTQSSSAVQKQEINKAPIMASSSTSTRDQWDAFGELIASEFRNLNSDLSRKKLKRRIMQVMLEVGDEDDGHVT